MKPRSLRFAEVRPCRAHYAGLLDGLDHLLTARERRLLRAEWPSGAALVALALRLERLPTLGVLFRGQWRKFKQAQAVERYRGTGARPWGLNERPASSERDAWNARRRELRKGVTPT